VLDLAAGSGRHTRYLRDLGFRVVAVEIDTSPMAGLAADDALELVKADLENAEWPFGGRRFDGIVVTNYLHRPLLPVLAESLSPGGVLIYETFAEGNEKYGRPSNPAFLLREGELMEAFSPALTVIAYEHGYEEHPRPAVRQRICVSRWDCLAKHPPKTPEGHAHADSCAQPKQQPSQRFVYRRRDKRQIAVEGALGGVEGEPACPTCEPE
jgi:SAM-dependent methyltransferase